MKCVILQPGYLPWLGFFDQMARADVFVVYDDVQYTKRDWRSRNRIKTADGIRWLTVPVLSKGRRHQMIHEAKINTERDWIHKHLASIKMDYAHATYFRSYFLSLKNILGDDHTSLLNLNMNLITCLKEALGLQTDLVFSSELHVKGKGTERLVRICRELGADEYLTGDAAADYLDEELFRRNQIKVEYHCYEHPIYPQLHGEFVPYLSVIDLLFNCGPDSLDVVTGKMGGVP